MAIELTDDGTLDTVLRCSDCGEEMRYTYDGSDVPRYALISDQGTMIPETVLTQDEYTDEGRAEAEANAPADAKRPFTWLNVTENEWFYDQFIEECIADATADHECPNDPDAEPSEPEDGDITTQDHENFYQSGKLVLWVESGDRWFGRLSPIVISEPLGTFADCNAALRAYMERVQFWPNAWFISDHGNAHLIDLSEGK